MLARFFLLVCLGSLIALPALAASGGGGAAEGDYFWADGDEPNGPMFDWEDLQGTNQASNASGCDDCIQGNIPIGFNFDFFGTEYSSVSVSSNGFIGFGSLSDSGCCSGDPIPSSGRPTNLVALWWDDLRPASGGTIWYDTRGNTGNRRFILSFQGVHHYFSGSPVDVQVKLFEGTDFIEIHYLNAVSDGGTHSTGIEDSTGTLGVQYYRGSQSMAANSVVRFFRCLFVDNDGDGFEDCDECDDFDPITYPGAAEICDGKDNDCDGTDPQLEIVDRDGDGFSFCDGDCDDLDTTSFGGAVELCDGIDNDCDGVVPDDEVDRDDDGFMECRGDCADDDPWIFPGYVDLCDGLDNNCDGRVDEGLSHDKDGDGHFAPGSCFGPADDCDDDSRMRYPGNVEVCDLTDNDCDELIDEGGICGGLGCDVGGFGGRPPVPTALWALLLGTLALVARREGPHRS